MIQALIPALAPLLGDIIRSKFPDPAEAAKLEAEMQAELWRKAHQLNAAAAATIEEVQQVVPIFEPE